MTRLLAIALCLIACGCASTPFKRQVHEVKFTLILDTSAGIQESYRDWCKSMMIPYQPVMGFRAFSKVYVPVSGHDMNGKPRPNFTTLGEEVWHIIKDDFHK